MVKQVTCISIGVYEHAITEGKVYDVPDIRNENFRIEGNHGRRVWISRVHFVAGNVAVPVLLHWCFDDAIHTFDFVEVTFSFSDGSSRWANVTTPEKLQHHFGNPRVYPPGMNMHHLIILRSPEDAEQTFRVLDRQNELQAATRPLE